MTTQPHDNPLVLPPLVSSPASPQFCQEGQRQPTLVPEAGGGSRPLRVLFMHGLESGPRGRRAMDMSRHFECYTPWMRNELEPLLGWWRNRTVRVCIALFIFLVVATACVPPSMEKRKNRQEMNPAYAHAHTCSQRDHIHSRLPLWNQRSGGLSHLRGGAGGGLLWDEERGPHDCGSPGHPQVSAEAAQGTSQLQARCGRRYAPSCSHITKQGEPSTGKGKTD